MLDASTTHAQSAVQLAYERQPGAESCLSAEVLRENVAARLGHDPFSESADLSLVVTVGRPSRRQWTGHIVLRRAGEVLGERAEQTGGLRCGPLMTRVEMAIAIALDPVSLAALTPPVPTPPQEVRDGVEAVPLTDPASVTVAPTLPVQVTPPDELVTENASESAMEGDRNDSEPLRFIASIAMHGAFFSAPSSAFGLTLGAGIMATRWSLQLEGRIDLPSADEVEGGQVESSLLLASVLPCFHHRWFFACAEFAGGVLRSEGVGFVRARRVTTSSWHAGGRLGVLLPLAGPLHLSAGVSVLAALSRANLVREDNTVAWQTRPAHLRLFLGPSVVF